MISQGMDDSKKANYLETDDKNSGYSETFREYEAKLIKYIRDNNINAEQLVFENSCHTVLEAAANVNASPQDLVKNICLMGGNDIFIVAIVNGEDRVSMSRVAKALELADLPRTATPEEILEKTGYICGGVPSFGYNAVFLIDPRVMESEYVYSGGGSPYSLVRISTNELQKANQGTIVRIRK